VLPDEPVYSIQNSLPPLTELMSKAPEALPAGQASVPRG
jgi:hypothetical protein